MSPSTSTPSPHPLFLWPLVLLGIAAISVASILIRLADAPVLAIAAYRVGLATAVLAPFLLHRPQQLKGRYTSRSLGLTILSGLFLAFHFFFWIHSLAMTSVASSVTLVSTTPLFVAIFSYLLLHERPPRLLAIGIFCTIGGSSLIAQMDFAFSREALMGDLLALLGALMASGYLLVGRLVRPSLDLKAYSFGSYGTAAAVLLASCYGTSTPLLGFSASTYIILALLALVPQLIGHTTFNWSLKFLPATVVAVLILGEPIGATFLAFLILGETVSGLRGIGLMILGIGIVVSSVAIPRR